METQMDAGFWNAVELDRPTSDLQRKAKRILAKLLIGFMGTRPKFGKTPRKSRNSAMNGHLLRDIGLHRMDLSMPGRVVVQKEWS